MAGTEAVSSTDSSMDAYTLEALQGSIKKWETVVAKGTDGTRWVDCPLCIAFFDHSCRGCPVRERSGRTLCRGTPFTQYEEARSLLAKRGADLLPFAQAELAFLKALLPQEVARG